MTVSLFIPCLTDMFFPETGMNMVKVLERIGAQVSYDKRQTCCGQPAFNTGYHDDARALAVRFVEIFREHEADYIVAPSGSCVTMVKLYGSMLSMPESLAADLRRVQDKLWEFTDFLVTVAGVTDVKAAFPAKVTLHDSCHALRELRIKNQPRALLKAVKGLDFVEMPNAETCCGFGGTFSVKYAELSSTMAEDKARWIAESGAEVVTGVDSSCLMQIDGMMKRKGMNVRAMHIADILALQ